MNLKTKLIIFYKLLIGDYEDSIVDNIGFITFETTSLYWSIRIMKK